MMVKTELPRKEGRSVGGPTLNYSIIQILAYR